MMPPPNTLKLNLSLDLTPDTDTWIPKIKHLLSETQATLQSGFQSRTPIHELVSGRSQVIDHILQALWQQSPKSTITLLAVGGYGRGELLPHSDIDLLFLHADSDENKALNTVIEGFIRLLWDIGLEVGHSVRTPKECAHQAASDVTIASNLLDLRFIAGDTSLLTELKRRLNQPDYWPTQQFFYAKLAEQKNRYLKHNQTEYNLEPDIKLAPGGLRDIHMIHWIARRHFNATTFEALTQTEFLTQDEIDELQRCQSFLWRLRFGLHKLTDRDDNRLLFDHQKSVAERLGYQGTSGQQAVEQMMKDYYRCALTIATLNETVLQHFEDDILNHPSKPTYPLNARYQVREGLLEVKNAQLFYQHPDALLDIFLTLANNGHLQGIRAKTLRYIRQASHDLIDDAYRSNPRHQGLFVQILQSPYQLYSTLTLMKRYGVLNRYLPAFEAIVGQMQFDLFHIYTVDAHTLRVIKNIRILRYSKSLDTFPIAAQLFHQFEKIELLYLAALFHDLAKGRGGDHSELGAEDAKVFCLQHGFSESETTLVAWLVEHHLLMSMTAQKQDLHDPEVIEKFAHKVGSIDYLNHLYVLTIADINATNPKLWNAWRAELLCRLYQQTKHYFHHAHSESSLPDPDEQLRKIQSSALNYLASANQNVNDAKTLWKTFDPSYFFKQTSETVAWHTEHILNHHSNNPTTTTPLIAIRALKRASKTSDDLANHTLEIFIYTPDRQHLFFDTVATLDRLGMNILDATIHSTTDNLSLDHYVAQIAPSSSLNHASDTIQQLHTTLLTALIKAADQPNTASIRQVRMPAKLKSFNVTTEVFIKPLTETNAGEKPDLTQVTLKTLDQPGLLAKIAEFFSKSGFDIQGAKVNTLGEKAEDIFIIRPQASKLVSDTNACPPPSFQQLKQALIDHLSIE